MNFRGESLFFMVQMVIPRNIVDIILKESYLLLLDIILEFVNLIKSGKGDNL
jgi:hypothetical protein